MAIADNTNDDDAANAIGDTAERLEAAVHQCDIGIRCIWNI